MVWRELSVASGVVATAEALTGDSCRRPAARTVVDRLTRIALLGATAIMALLVQWQAG